MSGAINVAVPIILHALGTATPADMIKPVPKLLTDLAVMVQYGQVDPRVIINDAVPIGAAVANYYAPGSGIALRLIVFALEHQKPWTEEETRRWWEREGIQSQ